MPTEDWMFHRLLDAAPDAMILVDQQGQVATLNAQAEKMFRYSRGELIGQPVELLVPERYRSAHVQHRGVYSAHPVTRPMGSGLDLYGRRKDGSEFPVEISLSPLVTEGRQLVVCAIRDITERRQSEQERARLIEERAAHAEASRIKDEFIATLSHELRTPLNAILGWTALLAEGVLDERAAREALHTIARNARAQVQLVEDLLDVSRIVAAKMTLNLQPLDFATMVENAVHVIRPSADSKLLTVEQVIETRPLLMIGDPDRLQQAAWNLLSNAVKFCNRGGRIEVRAWHSDEGIHLTVRDTGRGINPRFLPHVFDRFRQADSSYTREHGGLGLGLAIVRSIVELHGGAVTAASSGEGRGATFRVVLPARAPIERRQSPAAAVAPEEPHTLRGVRVVVVDDQPDERELLSAILSQSGAEVRTAGSAAEAVHVLADWPADVLVTDIAMPLEDGYILLRRVRDLDLGRRLPTIAVTAHARAEDRDRALKAGFQGYLAKPIEPARLVRAVVEQVDPRLRR